MQNKYPSSNKLATLNWGYLKSAPEHVIFHIGILSFSLQSTPVIGNCVVQIELCGADSKQPLRVKPLS